MIKPRLQWRAERRFLFFLCVENKSRLFLIRFLTHGAFLNAVGDLIVSDHMQHIVILVQDGKVVTTWGTPGTSGHSDGPADTTLFNAPFCIIHDGNMLLIICEDFEYGTRLVRCGETFFKAIPAPLYALYNDRARQLQ